MFNPHETPPQRRIKVDGGKSICVPIIWPHRSIITKVIVEQMEGTQGAFTVELYNHALSCEGDSISESFGPDEGEGPLPPRMFKVGPTMNGASGFMEYWSDLAPGAGAGLPFFNQDGRDEEVVPRARPKNLIYVKIAPSGSGDKEFAVVIGGFKAS